MIAVAGGILAALSWATVALCSARASRQIGVDATLAWVMGLGFVLVAPLIAIGGIPDALDGHSAAWLAVAGAGNVAGLTAEYAAFRRGQVGLVAPIIASEGAIAALVAVAFGEALTAGVAIVLAVIAAAIVLTALPDRQHAAVARGPSPTAAVIFSLGAAVLFGISLYAAGRAGSELPALWVALPARAVGVVVVSVPMLARRKLRSPGPAWTMVVIAAIGEVLGFVFYAWGAADGIAVASVLASQFAAVAAVGAVILLHERLGKVQRTGVIAMAAAVAVLGALRA